MSNQYAHEKAQRESIIFIERDKNKGARQRPKMLTMEVDSLRKTLVFGKTEAKVLKEWNHLEHIFSIPERKNKKQKIESNDIKMHQPGKIL